MLRSLFSVAAICSLLFVSLAAPSANAARRRCPEEPPSTILSLFKKSDAVYIGKFDKSVDGEVTRTDEHSQTLNIADHFSISTTIKGDSAMADPAGGPRVRPSDGRSAAIGPRRAAELYGGVVLASDIADRPDNHTRFVVVGREPVSATGAGSFKTSIVCTLGHDRPGALLAILQEFAMRAVNLTKLESRPAKTSLGSYIFFIDIEGSRERDLPVDAAIRALEEQGVATVNFLGSFPTAAEPG
jgi:hypothetical protein